MSKFLIVDASHLFHRAKHSVRGTDEEKVGMCMHIIFNSLQKAWRVQQTDHVVFAFDGRSWRKDVYAPYKRNRSELRHAKSAEEQAQDILFFEAFDQFRQFIAERTNCTVLSNDHLEADDLIAGFVQSHPNDHHVIVSNDGDFAQLLASNVVIYNGVADQTTTVEGVFDYRGNAVRDNKTGQAKKPADPQWSIFEKCMRGCSTDNIFAAYPGARIKNTKQKIGLLEAYEDRHKQGFSWSSIMMHRWADAQGIEHRVRDDYERNRQLIDLSAQPENIRADITKTISEACIVQKKPQIGFYFLKFCGKFELIKISEQSDTISKILAASYPA